ncbi:MAG: FAD:protein FMN transferase [Alicyclobacillus herbarius]|uniref:FAD:protein FMN transferase n=1 Tax=Alicyclobacillus herbarius TaxID=122960 RepID=UPI0023529A2F|nr:FAD:protein FMN transferase [Alicyclobacillus herbarius]MCL6633519.1 FAD:protein FMN transferase [Alicyclobacillus herbarius]
MMRHTFRALGTTVEMGVASSPEGLDTPSILTACEAQIHRYEQRLSRFLPDSDVAHINRHPGEWVTVHPGTATVVELAIEAFMATGGLFHPALAGWLEAYGYGVSFDQVPVDSAGPPVSLPPAPADVCPVEVRRTPDQEQICRQRLDCVQTPATASAKPSQTPAHPRQVRVLPGWKLDLGGIGKGWIVERAADFLRAAGLRQFVVSAGGDMVCAETKAGIPWRIRIDDPLGGAAPVLTLSVENLAVATSGTYQRRWRQGGREVHHILNPRTGRPAETDVVSCTVLHPRLVAAEVLAKTALILGWQEGELWLRERAPDGWVMVSQEGKVKHSWQS